MHNDSQIDDSETARFSMEFKRWIFVFHYDEMFRVHYNVVGMNDITFGPLL